jgi:putative endonuclease
MFIEKQPAVYIIASQRNGTIYTGVTSVLYDRISTHKAKSFAGFSSKHGCKLLVWYEHHATMEQAIRREKQIKEWHRTWKLRLIETMNPRWDDLHEQIDPIGTLVNLD